MRKTTFLLLLLLGNTISAFSQPVNNMYLLANVNEHPGNPLYSACWGYRASDGREYALLGAGTGTAFIDITDSANIHEVDFLPGLTSSWREMKVHSHYAYIVSEAAGSGMQIVDLQYLPDSVHLVTTFFFPGYSRTHTIQRSGPYLYMNGGDYLSGGVFVLDVTNPELPVKRGQWEEEYVHDCRVVDDTIWTADIFDDNIGVINAADKDNLQLITTWINLPNPFPHNCAIPGDRRYIYTTDETSSPPGVLKVWNKQDLQNVTLVTTWHPTNITTSIVHNVEILGNLAVIAHYTAGVRVLDITNPASPVEIAWYDTYPASDGNTYDGCWGVFMFRGSGKIIGSDRQTGLYVLKVGTLTGIETQNEVSSAYRLDQNYPNPFNPSTTIRYSIPQSGHVSLRVFDALGRQAGVMVDEYQQAGEHSVRFDAGSLASGIYYYHLQAGQFSQTKRMTLLK